MEFTKKNDFIVKNKKEEHFERDLELFKSTCPNSRIHSDLKRLNSFNRSKIHGMLLVELLDKVSPEEILKNRQETTEVIQDQGEPETIIDTVEGVKEIFASEMDLELIEEDVFQYLVGRTEEEIKALIALTKGSIKSTQEQPPIVETVEDVKSIVAVEMDIENFPEEVFTGFIGKTADEIRTIITFGKTIKILDNEISTETGNQTTGNAGSEIKDTNPDPENETDSDGVPSGETVSKLQQGEDQSGSSDTVSIATGSDADASGLEHKESGSMEGSGGESAGDDPEKKEDPAITSEAVKPEKSEVVHRPVQPRKPRGTKPANKKKGAKKKSSRK